MTSIASTSIASRDLRNRTADVLRQVAGGTQVTITVNGVPVADLTAHRRGRSVSLSRHEVGLILENHQADPGLRSVLGERVGDDTDSLGPLT